MQGLIPVKPGYFLPENVVQKMIELYPELEQTFENALQVEAGYFLSDEGVVGLANFIKDLEDENVRLELLAEKLNSALEKEREVTQMAIEEKDRVISLQSEQLKDYKELLNYPNKDYDLLEKAGQAASIITFLLLIANI
ncbi:MAG: hypothetical protein GX207_05445 [Peptococcaceae bacterium]|nr:hypothetical protein [Peptococcaceae bacterium]